MIDLQERLASELVSPTDIVEHLHTLMDLVHELGARTVVELGVRWGSSTVAWLVALERHDGRLWSVDVAHQWGSLEHPSWTVVLGDDLDSNVLAQLPAMADIVFVDTIHTYEHTAEELRVYSPRVLPGGALVLHDTEHEVFDHHVPGTQPPYPVRVALDEWLAAETRTWDREHHPNCHGLTILRNRP